MGRLSKTKNQKKERAAAQHRSQEEYSGVPHSFVFHRGHVGKNLQQLILDVRRVMEPYTATNLKVRKKNTLKDFVAVAGPLGVTHFLVFTKTPTTVNLKLFRLPGGPSLTFRVTQYSLIKDVVSSLKRHRMHEQQFTHHPLLILNNFGLQGMHIKVMASMFQNMFPSINVHKINLNAIKRCVLISYDADSQTLEFRHYSLKVVPVGMSKGLKKFLQEKFPNMNRLQDISELLVNCSKGQGQQVASLDDMQCCDATFVHKTEQEIQEALVRKEEKLQLKAERRRKQEVDVERKQEQKTAHRKKSLEGIKKKKRQAEGGDSDAEDPGMQEDQNADEPSDDDTEYYRQEVGEEPDEDLFPQSTKRKRGLGQSIKPRKRCKYSRSAGDQNPAPAGRSPKAKHKRIRRPGQGWQPRDSPGLREQQQGTRQLGRARNAKRKPAQGPGRNHTKQQRGSKPQGPWRQGKPGLLRRQAPKGKGAFGKQRRSGRKGPV
ncbi:PREDICTED: suppressor of SWI4 1 homolog [Gekko japonicus]|uniref:Suppressor of SWI4 1 homolog n=2 Tax=Gekko japonicus TaxID=146911 RepID=A0ABM1KRL4_GEKJA|nr:PREDICTED: suppressor of SWI4 1 homolog [Gekko japonicus]